MAPDQARPSGKGRAPEATGAPVGHAGRQLGRPRSAGARLSGAKTANKGGGGEVRVCVELVGKRPAFHTGQVPPSEPCRRRRRDATKPSRH